MPRTVYSYTPAGLREDKVVDSDMYDECPGLDGLQPSPTDLERDSQKDYCKPSSDISARMERQVREKNKFFAFVTLARSHCGGLALSEYGFPGCSRMETILERAITRTTTIIRLNGPLCKRSLELITLSVDEMYGRVKLTAEEVILDHYGLKTKHRVHPPQDTVARAICEDNYLHEVWSRDGLHRKDPFRHPAIAQVFGKALLGADCADMYGFKAYFYPKVPSTVIVLICTAIRAALDEHAKPIYTPRDFSRDQYGSVLRDLSYRWAQLPEAYALETQTKLSQTIQLAMRKKSVKVPGMLPKGPNTSIPELHELYEWVGAV